MPATVLKGWAKKFKLPIKKLEALWDRAKAIAFKQYGKDSVRAYKVVVSTILPNMIKKKFGVSVRKEDSEYFKLFDDIADAQKTNPKSILKFNDKFVAVYEDFVDGAKEAIIGITTFEKELSFLPIDETLIKKLAAKLEEKFQCKLMMKRESARRMKLKTSGKNKKKNNDDGEYEDVYIPLKNENDILEVTRLLRIWVASALFEEIRNESYVQNLQERFAYKDRWRWDDFGAMLSPFYVDVTKEYYSPVVEAFALTAVKTLINTRKPLFTEELSQLSSIRMINHSELFKKLAVVLEGITVPDWFYQQLYKSWNQESHAYDDKIVKLHNLWKRHPAQFEDVAIGNIYSPRDRETFMAYVATNPGKAKNSKTALQFLEDIGAVCGHLSEEVTLFIEKIKVRLVIHDQDIPDEELDISDYENA